MIWNLGKMRLRIMTHFSKMVFRSHFELNRESNGISTVPLIVYIGWTSSFYLNRLDFAFIPAYRFCASSIHNFLLLNRLRSITIESFVFIKVFHLFVTMDLPAISFPNLRKRKFISLHNISPGHKEMLQLKLYICISLI